MTQPHRPIRPRAAIPLAVLAALALAAPLHAQNVSVHGIDSLHLRANIQPRFDTTTVDGEPSSGWEVRRARIMLRMFAAGWIRADVEGDFGRGRARLTDGYVRMDFAPEARVRAGQFKKPFDALELTSSRELLVVERDGLPRGAGLPTPNGVVHELGYNDRDIGAEWSGRFAPLTLTAGFWNGAGANASEDDDGKQVGVRAEVPVGGDWRLAGAWAGIRRSAPEEAPGADGRWWNAFEVAATAGEYAEPGWKALLQLMAGDGEPLGVEVTSDLARFTTLQALAAYYVPVFSVPYVVGVEPVARFGWADPDTDADDDEATLWTAGINLYHHEHVKTQLQVDHVRPSEGDGETAVRIQATLGF